MANFCSIPGGLLDRGGYLEVRSIMVLDKAFNIAKNTKSDGYQSRLLQRFITNKYIFDCSVTHKQTEIKSDLVSENRQIVEELHKPIISKLEKRKLYFFFKRQNFES